MSEQRHYFQDARLKKALENTPDKEVQPGAGVRTAILNAAKKSVEQQALLTPTIKTKPVEQQLSWLERICTYLFGSPRMAWSAIGGFLVVGVVALLWSINDPQQALDQGDLLETKAPSLPLPIQQDEKIPPKIVTTDHSTIMSPAEVDEDRIMADSSDGGSNIEIPVPIMPAPEIQGDKIANPATEIPAEVATQSPYHDSNANTDFYASKEQGLKRKNAGDSEAPVKDAIKPSQNTWHYADKYQHSRRSGSKTAAETAPTPAFMNKDTNEKSVTFAAKSQESMRTNRGKTQINPNAIELVEPIPIPDPAQIASAIDAPSAYLTIVLPKEKAAPPVISPEESLAHAGKAVPAFVIGQKNDSVISDTGHVGFNAGTSGVAEPHPFPLASESKVKNTTSTEQAKRLPKTIEAATEENVFSTSSGATASQIAVVEPPVAAELTERTDNRRIAQKPVPESPSGFSAGREEKNRFSASKMDGVGIKDIRMPAPPAAMRDRPIEEQNHHAGIAMQGGEAIEKTKPNALLQQAYLDWDRVKVTLPRSTITQTFTRNQAKELASVFSQSLSNSSGAIHEIPAEQFKPTTQQLKLHLMRQHQSIATVYLDAKNWYFVSQANNKTTVIKGTFHPQQLDACLEYLRRLMQ